MPANTARYGEHGRDFQTDSELGKILGIGCSDAESGERLAARNRDGARIVRFFADSPASLVVPVPPRPQPLVSFDRMYYRYPRSLCQGQVLRALSAQLLDEFEIKARRSWLEQARRASESPFADAIEPIVAGIPAGGILRGLVESHGPYAERFFGYEVMPLLIPEVLRWQVDPRNLESAHEEAYGYSVPLARSGDIVLRISDFLFDRACSELLENQSVIAAIESFLAENSVNRRCDICGSCFRVIDLPAWIYGPAGGTKFCCYGCPLGRPRKANLFSLVPDFVNACGFIPHADASVVNRGFTSRLQDDRKRNVFKQLIEMGSLDHVKQKFGSWFEALVATNVLPEGIQPTGRGFRCIADDGHICNSLDEQAIDNWLNSQGIQHEKEPRYPTHPRYNISGKRRADWKIDEVYVEYFGLRGEESYDIKTSEKLDLCRELGVPLIPIFPADLNSLGSRLGPALEAAARVRAAVTTASSTPTICE